MLLLFLRSRSSLLAERCYRVILPLGLPVTLALALNRIAVLLVRLGLVVVIVLLVVWILWIGRHGSTRTRLLLVTLVTLVTLVVAVRRVVVPGGVLLLIRSRSNTASIVILLLGTTSPSLLPVLAPTRRRILPARFPSLTLLLSIHLSYPLLCCFL